MVISELQCATSVFAQNLKEYYQKSKKVELAEVSKGASKVLTDALTAVSDPKQCKFTVVVGHSHRVVWCA